MNKVKVVIIKDDRVIFILQTEGDSDYWYWEVSMADIQSYYGFSPNVLSVDSAEKYCNDENNAHVGFSSSGYEKINEIYKEIGHTNIVSLIAGSGFGTVSHQF